MTLSDAHDWRRKETKFTYPSSRFLLFEPMTSMPVTSMYCVTSSSTFIKNSMMASHYRGKRCFGRIGEAMMLINVLLYPPQ